MRIKVKVGFIEGAEEWQINFFLRRFQKIDGSVLEFEIDKERADFLIAFPWLYTSSRENYLQFLEESRGKIVIMDVLGEALAPNLNLFDYHIGFDAPDDDGRLLCMSYLFDLRMKLKDLHTMNPDDALCGKDGFCNYIYSHGLGHPYRIQLFSELSAYKKVDAIGKHLNNTPCLIPREAEDWLAGSVLLKKPYKFSIACENSWYRRYTTEKIITSFLACTVPVYWGNPLVEEEYNPKAFINCHRYSSLKEVVAEIKRIDEDEELWKAMMAEPRRLPWQIEREQEKKDKFNAELMKFFTSPVEHVRKRGDGFWMNNYRNFFTDKMTVKKEDDRKKLKSALKEWNKRLFPRF